MDTGDEDTHQDTSDAKKEEKEVKEKHKEKAQTKKEIKGFLIILMKSNLRIKIKFKSYISLDKKNQFPVKKL